MNNVNKAIFLDRDGVINKKAPKHEYITSIKEFEFLEGVLEGLKKLGELSYKIIIITNQRGIARKKMSELDLIKIHKDMMRKIIKSGGRVDRIYYCPHNKGECNCRKPLPGMIERAKEDFNIDLKNSWLVGDSESDIVLGKRVGCKTIFVGKKNEFCADYLVKKLFDVVNIIG